MRVGVLTYYNAINYGAALQAYALVCHLNSITGIHAELINYCSPAIEQQYAWISLSKAVSIKAYILNNLTVIGRKKKKKHFKAFFDKLRIVGKKVITISDLTKEKYDLVIVGSDQVWNPDCSKGDSLFLLDKYGDTFKRISYAASVGSINKLNLFSSKYNIDFIKIALLIKEKHSVSQNKALSLIIKFIKK